jgi:hypothetical protein
MSISKQIDAFLERSEMFLRQSEAGPVHEGSPSMEEAASMRRDSVEGPNACRKDIAAERHDLQPRCCRTTPVSADALTLGFVLDDVSELS